jgi:hypothetical protein
VRLVDLSPRWGIDTDLVIGGFRRYFDDRRGMAVSFDCPCGCQGTPRETRLAVWFANPIDCGPPTASAERLWQRTGDTFETLSLRPSIDASMHGHWHGFITAGEVR